MSHVSRRKLLRLLGTLFIIVLALWGWQVYTHHHQLNTFKRQHPAENSIVIGTARITPFKNQITVPKSATGGRPAHFQLALTTPRNAASHRIATLTFQTIDAQAQLQYHYKAQTVRINVHQGTAQLTNVYDLNSRGSKLLLTQQRFSGTPTARVKTQLRTEAKRYESHLSWLTRNVLSFENLRLLAIAVSKRK